MLDKTNILNGNSKVEKARRIYAALGGHHPEIDLVLNRIFRIVSEPLTVAVMGEFSAGKSSFLNRLLHIDALPISVLPKTATLTRLVYGTTPAVEIEYEFDRKKVIQYKEGYESFKELQSAAKIHDPLFLQELERIREVRVHIDSPRLKTFELLDTPGFNHDAAMDAKSLQALEHTDLIVWISDYTQAAKKTEFEKLQYIKERVGRLHLVINKGDIHVHDSESHQQALQEVSESLAANGFLNFFDNDTPYLISCKSRAVQSNALGKPPPARGIQASKAVLIICTWFDSLSSGRKTSRSPALPTPGETFWDGIFEQFAADFGASVLNADLALSVALIDEQWQQLEHAVKAEADAYDALLAMINILQQKKNIEELVERNWETQLSVVNNALLRVRATLLEHCRSSGEPCKPGVLSAAALALEYTKATLHDEFCEFRMGYTKCLLDLDTDYCKQLLKELQDIDEKIPQQHPQLKDTARRLVAFYTLRTDSSITHADYNLPASSRTLEMLDHMGVQFWNRKSDCFDIDWKQAFFGTVSDPRTNLTTLPFDQYAWLQLKDSLFTDFRSDIVRLASDPVVQDFIEESRREFKARIDGLRIAAGVRG